MARPRNPAPPLRATLAQVARQIIVERGVEALTVRAAAAESGVTANAPYHHFPGGLPELIASTAIGGFVELRTALGHPPLPAPPADAVRALMVRYVEFGVRNANLYRAMFHHRIAEPLEAPAADQKGESTYAELRVLKAQAYEDIVAPLSRLRAEGSLRGGHPPRGAPGLALAALAHGLVGEFIDEGLVRPDDDEPWTSDRREMTVEVTDVMLLGLLGDSAVGRGVEGRPAPESLRPEDDPSWRAYHDAVLEFFPGEYAVAIDLRQPVSERDLERLRERGLPDRFSVFTACNPRGRAVSAEENARRDRALKERLRSEGQMWVRCDGVSADRAHREVGVATGLSKEDARRLAIEFEQSAIYWFDGEGFWIVGAVVEAEAVSLPN